MSFVFFYKVGEQEGRTGPFWGFGTSRRGRMWEKSVRGEHGANTVYTCM
jgi:hypothetical protein